MRVVLERVEARDDVRVVQRAMECHLGCDPGQVHLRLQQDLGGDGLLCLILERGEQIGAAKRATTEADAAFVPLSRPQLTICARLPPCSPTT